MLFVLKSELSSTQTIDDVTDINFAYYSIFYCSRLGVAVLALNMRANVCSAHTTAGCMLTVLQMGNNVYSCRC
jgi:hypothetical protein